MASLLTIGSSHPKYRPDVDGLRAIAVLSVVGFHTFPHLVKGGFIGVDIFFVISGFLISTIIFGSLAKGVFTFTDFYVRRIKRIFPSLLVVLLFVFVIGWNMLFQVEFKELNRHIAAGAGFLSNIVLWHEAGYFDTASDTKPLLHLWSLGIEEQFYLVWPVLLWLTRKQRFRFELLIVVALASFLVNVINVGGSPVAAFYSPLARIWELALGSCLALWLSARHASVPSFIERNGILSGAGLLLLVLGFVLVTGERQFPGWWALLPCAGAVLIIAAGTNSIVNRVILSSPILVWFGLISYPLYLWHWPLLTFLRVAVGGAPSTEALIAAVLLSILLAWLTYTWIESPIRFRTKRKSVAGVLLLAMTIMGLVAGGCFLKERKEGLARGFTALNPVSGTAFDGGDLGNVTKDCGIPGFDRSVLSCLRDSRYSPRVALLGDSKAASLFDGLIRTSSSANGWLYIGATGRGAPMPLISRDPIYASYQQPALAALRYLTDDPRIDTVVIAVAMRSIFQLKNDHSIEDLPASKNFPEALQGLSAAVRQLLGAGKRIVIVVDNPSLKPPVSCLPRVTRFGFVNDLIAHAKDAEHCSISVSRHLQLSAQYRRLLDVLHEIDPDKVRIFDTMPQLCDMNAGMCLPVKNGRLLYSYSDHISDYAAGLIGTQLNDFLANWARQRVSP